MLAPFPDDASGKEIHLPMQEMQEKWVGSLGQEDPLEEDVVTHSSILAWRIPWTGEPGGLLVYRVAKHPT